MLSAVVCLRGLIGRAIMRGVVGSLLGTVLWHIVAILFGAPFFLYTLLALRASNG